MIGVEPRPAGAGNAGRPVLAAQPCRRRSARARTEHPTITTAAYNVDVAAYQVKVAEGALYPDR